MPFDNLWNNGIMEKRTRQPGLPGGVTGADLANRSCCFLNGDMQTICPFSRCAPIFGMNGKPGFGRPMQWV
jgi:hypothetical protein